MTTTTAASTASPTLSTIPPHLVDKAKLLSLILSQPQVDLWKLRELALTEGGLINDAFRRRAWPKLVGLHDVLWDETGAASFSRRNQHHRRQQQQQQKESLAEDQDTEPAWPRASLSSTAANTTAEDVDTVGNPAESVFRAKRNLRSSSLRLSLKETGGMSTKLQRRLSASKSADQTDEEEKSMDSSSISSVPSTSDKILAISLDFDQIERDVARCTWHLLTGTQRSQRLQMEHKRQKKVARLIRRKQRRLANLINLALVQSYQQQQQQSSSSSPSLSTNGNQNFLRYYQGYHDVACIILATLSGSHTVSFSSKGQVNQPPLSNTVEGMAASMGLDLPAAVLLQVSKSHFRDCLKSNFAQLQAALRLTLFPLLAYFDPEVHTFLCECEMEPFFCLSWVITWFAHEIRDTELVKRLFDAFLVSHPLMPIYMSVAMILHPTNRQEILHTECDFSLVHQTLTGLPRNSSMVGWKYRPGDGYISDDEEDDAEDDGTMSSSGSDAQEADFLLFHAALTGEHKENDDGGAHGASSEAVSIVSSSLSSLVEPPGRVPFQELIDQALVYMRRIPPRKVLKLASRYYGKKQVEALMDPAPDISMMEPPPVWSLVAHAKSDWVLKQRVRELRGQSSTTRSDRRKRSRQGTTRDGADADDSSSTSIDPFDEKATVQYLKEQSRNVAVVALGFGPGDDEERKHRKRRRMMMVSAVAVALVAVALGVVWQNRGSRTKPSSSSVVAVGETRHPNVAIPQDDILFDSRNAVVDSQTMIPGNMSKQGRRRGSQREMKGEVTREVSRKNEPKEKSKAVEDTARKASQHDSKLKEGDATSTEKPAGVQNSTSTGSGVSSDKPNVSATSQMIPMDKDKLPIVTMAEPVRGSSVPRDVRSSQSAAALNPSTKEEGAKASSLPAVQSVLAPHIAHENEFMNYDRLPIGDSIFGHYSFQGIWGFAKQSLIEEEVVRTVKESTGAYEDLLTAVVREEIISAVPIEDEPLGAHGEERGPRWQEFFFALTDGVVRGADRARLVISDKVPPQLNSLALEVRRAVEAIIRSGKKQQVAVYREGPAWGKFFNAVRLNVGKRLRNIRNKVDPNIRSLSDQSIRFVNEAFHTLFAGEISLLDKQVALSNYSTPWARFVVALQKGVSRRAMEATRHADQFRKDFMGPRVRSFAERIVDSDIVKFLRCKINLVKESAFVVAFSRQIRSLHGAVTKSPVVLKVAELLHAASLLILLK